MMSSLQLNERAVRLDTRSMPRALFYKQQKYYLNVEILTNIPKFVQSALSVQYDLNEWLWWKHTSKGYTSCFVPTYIKF